MAISLLTEIRDLLVEQAKRDDYQIQVQRHVARAVIKLHESIDRIEGTMGAHGHGTADWSLKVPRNHQQPHHERREEGRHTEQMLIERAIAFSLDSAPSELRPPSQD